MREQLLRVLVIAATDGFAGALPLSGAAVRVLELNRHLAESDLGVQVEVLLYDRGRSPGSEPVAGWPFPCTYLSPGDFCSPQRLRQLVLERRPEVLVLDDSALVVRCGRQLADLVGASLVYEMRAVEHEPLLSPRRRVGVQAEAIQLADAVVALTGRDLRHAVDTGAGQVSIVPAGTAPAPVTGGWVQEGPVAMAADFTRSGNAQALLTLHARLPQGIPVAVYGRFPPSLPPTVPRFELHGPVPDLAAILTGASAGIACHSEASGMRAQVLAYMAAGLPVIATPEALAGFPRTWEFALVSEQPAMADLPSLLDQLHGHPSRARARGRRGRRLAEGPLSWGSIATRAASAYRSVRPARAGSQPRSEVQALAERAITGGQPAGASPLSPVLGPGSGRERVTAS
ncbi:hypothetical protein V7793_06005 [Streptomyces sp. KLMMK]|uniref:glycosyltransferase n=1 Tax=Streptomyces sp. KLMMK TaxID=3109353 RepID=UPI002FFFD3DF